MHDSPFVFYIKYYIYILKYKRSASQHEPQPNKVATIILGRTKGLDAIKENQINVL